MAYYVHSYCVASIENLKIKQDFFVTTMLMHSLDEHLSYIPSLTAYAFHTCVPNKHIFGDHRNEETSGSIFNH